MTGARREIRAYRDVATPWREPPYYLYDYLHSIVLEPIARPTVDQIRALREIGLGMTSFNMLELRKILVEGGFGGFGAFIEETARQLSARLHAAGLPHRIEKSAKPCQIVITKRLRP
jgi:hypothetical protein